MSNPKDTDKLNIPIKQIGAIVGLIVGIIALLSTITGFYWNNSLSPKVDARIDLKMKPSEAKLDKVLISVSELSEAMKAQNKTTDSSIKLQGRVLYKMNPEAYRKAKKEIIDEQEATK